MPWRRTWVKPKTTLFREVTGYVANLRGAFLRQKNGVALVDVTTGRSLRQYGDPRAIAVRDGSEYENRALSPADVAVLYDDHLQLPDRDVPLAGVSFDSKAARLTWVRDKWIGVDRDGHILTWGPSASADEVKLNSDARKSVSYDGELIVADGVVEVRQSGVQFSVAAQMMKNRPGWREHHFLPEQVYVWSTEPRSSAVLIDQDAVSGHYMDAKKHDDFISLVPDSERFPQSRAIPPQVEVIRGTPPELEKGKAVDPALDFVRVKPWMGHKTQTIVMYYPGREGPRRGLSRDTIDITWNDTSETLHEWPHYAGGPAFIMACDTETGLCARARDSRHDPTFGTEGARTAPVEEHVHRDRRQATRCDASVGPFGLFNSNRRAQFGVLAP
jgi:hypothetical protein